MCKKVIKNIQGISLISFKSKMNIKSLNEENMTYKVKNWKGPLLVLLFGLALISTLYISFYKIGDLKSIN